MCVYGWYCPGIPITFANTEYRLDHSYAIHRVLPWTRWTLFGRWQTYCRRRTNKDSRITISFLSDRI